ncbi:amino acid permease [Actinomyces minihominis]|uniref:amino acid permease n=1 Tax=Actinomyces minihominis TaxID=2002838 RepID=UPI000C07334F|nr:amino acid permease [Actinomyces minihominis]
MSSQATTAQVPSAPPVSSGKKRSKSSSGGITIFGLAMLNVAAVAALANDSQQAEYGLASVTYFAIAALLFLVPICLVAAELATGWPEPGGVFRWIGEGLGAGLGFTAIFLLFVEVTISQAAGLSSTANILGFFQTDIEVAMKWAENPTTWVVLVFGICYFWAVTLLATRGVTVFQNVAKYGVVFGTLLPLAAMVVLVLIWLGAGNKPAIDMSFSGLIPEWSGLGTLALAAGVFFSYAGMEMNAAHIKQLKNPRRAYPAAILIAAILSMLIFMIGTVIIAMVIPQKDINIIYALYSTFYEIGKAAGIPWVFTAVAWLTLIAGLAGVISWLAGVPLMLVNAGRGGFLPRWAQKTNSKGMPARLMFLMATVISLILIALVAFPDVEGFYAMLTQTVTILYLLMYVLMFLAFIRLRRTQPHRPRSFRVPGGKAGAWIVTVLGIGVSGFGILLAFFPPSQIAKEVGSPIIYVGGIALMVGLTILLAFAIIKARKPEWVDPTNPAPPFTWQIEGLKKPVPVKSNVPTEMLSDGQAGMGQPIVKPYSPNDQITEEQLIAGGFLPEKHRGKTGAPAQATMAQVPTTTATSPRRGPGETVTAEGAPAATPSSPVDTPKTVAPSASSPAAPAPAPTAPVKATTTPVDPSDPAAVAAAAAQEAAAQAQALAAASQALAQEALADRELAEAQAKAKAAHEAALAAEERAHFTPSQHLQNPKEDEDGKTN